MDRKELNQDDGFNASTRLAQRLYSKYSDTGQIIPNVGKNMMKLKGRLAPKVKLPKINKIENTSKKEYPPIHYPKGFEKFTMGLEAKAKEREIKGIKMDPEALQLSLRDSPIRVNKKMLMTMAPSPVNEPKGTKRLMYPPNKLIFDEKSRYSTLGSINVDGIKSVTMLRKGNETKQSYVIESLGDIHKKSHAKLKPIENAPSLPDDTLKPLEFNKDVGGSLSTKDIEEKMNAPNKDNYLTPLDFIAC